MSILVVGVSHRTAPVSLLEQLTLDPDGVQKLIQAVVSTDHVQEATVVATCNRLEIYTEVDRFHGSVEVLCQALCADSGEPAEALLPHLYVHYDDAAVSHLFHVAAGLDSMVVGEGQVLGQTREALRLGQELGTVGPALNAAFQQALRVAKRTHAETGIDRVAPSLVSVALDRATAATGPVQGRHALVVGAGSMAGLAVATLVRSGVAEVAVVNRTEAKATRLAAQYAATAPGGPVVRSARLADLTTELAKADLVVSCTGAVGSLLGIAEVSGAVLGRTAGDRAAHTAILDLALPHDVDPAVGKLPGVLLVNLAVLAEQLTSTGDPASVAEDLEGVRRIVAEEVAVFLAARRVASVTPTVVALRGMATEVVEAELSRLFARVAGLDDDVRAEVEQTVRRVADKLVHQPTVRVKELANTVGAVSYAAALAELFSLDPDAVEAVTRPTEGGLR